MKKSFLIFPCCFILFICASCGINTPEKAVRNYFSALNRLEFTKAAELLGNAAVYDHLTAVSQSSGTYLESVINDHFVSFVYSNAECEIISAAKNGFECEIKTKITSYNINDVIQTQQNLMNEYTASAEYLKLDTGQRYVQLCDQIDVFYKQIPKLIQPVSTETMIYLKQKNGSWTIVPTRALFAALAGGADNNQ